MSRLYRGLKCLSNGMLQRGVVDRTRVAIGARCDSSIVQRQFHASANARTTRVNTVCCYGSSSASAAAQRRSISVGAVRLADVQTVKTPSFPESVAQGDLRWVKKIGDSVRVDEIVAEIETDKTMIPVPSPVNGVITELLAADGAKVSGHQELFKVQLGDGAAAATAAAPAAKAPPAAAPKVQAPAPAAAPSQPRAAQTGALRRPPPPAGSAQAQAQPVPVTSAPAPPAAKAETRPAPKAVPVVSATQQKITPGVERILGSRSEHRVRMSRLRVRIAERLKEAQNTCAMLTTFNEVDMSGVLEMRKKYGDLFLKKHGIKLGVMGPFVKAAAYALDQMPIVNAVIDNQEIVYRDYIDISVAVSAPRGLVVPVIRGVESMNYVDIERAIANLSEKARKETLSLEEMEGGTFTVSNGGVFGSLISTPIINLPQSAILGMHASFDRPVAVNGKVEIRPMMYITMTYDHRLIDGREAVTFLRTIKAAVEDPRILQLDL